MTVGSRSQRPKLRKTGVSDIAEAVSGITPRGSHTDSSILHTAAARVPIKGNYILDIPTPPSLGLYSSPYISDMRSVDEPPAL